MFVHLESLPDNFLYRSGTLGILIQVNIQKLQKTEKSESKIWFFVSFERFFN